MARSPRILRLCLLALILATLCARTRGDRDPIGISAAHLFPANMPRTILWAWEEPEDLRAVDPARVGVAFLAARVFVGDRVSSVPRRQPILVPPGIWAEAVVRVEATAAFHDNDATRSATANAIISAAQLPGIRAVEIDFDATQSQRAFYADVLRQVRAALPSGERLDITALASWCAQSNGWLHGLPIDAAVPMNFRLGRHTGMWGVREPLCAGAIGVSTDEPANRPAAAQPNRVTYIFSPRPFTGPQLALLNQGNIPNDAKGAR